MTPGALDPRLVLSGPELDAALEQVILSEAVLWSAVDAALAGEAKLGRGHWRAAFLVKRRPGVGVKEIAALTGLSKQGASRILAELEAAGLVEKGLVERGVGEDARRRPVVLTPAGRAFEARGSEPLRAALARAYRTAGVEHATGARRVWGALCGRTASSRPPREDEA